MKGAIVIAIFAVLATAYCYTDAEIQTKLRELCIEHGDSYLIPDVVDCHSFYECVGYAGIHTKLTCPNGLVYNAELKACDYPQTTTCSEILS